jgi:hypothetical protein
MPSQTKLSLFVSGEKATAATAALRRSGLPLTVVRLVDLGVERVDLPVAEMLGRELRIGSRQLNGHWRSLSPVSIVIELH